MLKTNTVGKNILNYDSMLVLAHFKGHPMGGYGEPLFLCIGELPIIPLLPNPFGHAFNVAKKGGTL